MFRVAYFENDNAERHGYDVLPHCLHFRVKTALHYGPRTGS